MSYYNFISYTALWNKQVKHEWISFSLVEQNLKKGGSFSTMSKNNFPCIRMSYYNFISSPILWSK